MSRSNYHDDIDNWDLIRWRGAVASAINGKRGQAFLIELAEVLDSMPRKRLIQHELVTESGECCTMGAVLKARGRDVKDLDPEEPDDVSAAVGLSDAMVREIAYLNDDCGSHEETPEERWSRMRKWVDSNLKKIQH
jgi:hypothetical protein